VYEKETRSRYWITGKRVLKQASEIGRTWGKNNILFWTPSKHREKAPRPDRTTLRNVITGRRGALRLREDGKKEEETAYEMKETGSNIRPSSKIRGKEHRARRPADGINFFGRTKKKKISSPSGRREEGKKKQSRCKKRRLRDGCYQWEETPPAWQKRG